jgi:hypothetical protein
MLHIKQHISTRDAKKHVFFKTPLNHQQNPTAHKPVTLTINILLSDVFPSTPLTYIKQFLTPVTTERYEMPQYIIAIVEGIILKYVGGVRAGEKCEI